jgi:hypothetical protein
MTTHVGSCRSILCGSNVFRLQNDRPSPATVTLSRAVRRTSKSSPDLRLRLDSPLVVGNPSLRRGFAGKGADGRGLRIRDAHLDGEHVALEGNDAIGSLSVRVGHVEYHSCSDELIFPDNALVAVRLALDPVLKNAGCLG